MVDRIDRYMNIVDELQVVEEAAKMVYIHWCASLGNIPKKWEELTSLERHTWVTTTMMAKRMYDVHLAMFFQTRPDKIG